MKLIGLIGAIAAAMLGGSVCRALAATTPGWECIPTTAGQPVVSGGTGAAPSCGGSTTPVLAPTYVSSGVGGKPTVVFASVNVQIVSGSGSTSGAVNGEGNLVVGYAENAGGKLRTGSNDLVLGANNGWTGFGEFVSGVNNVARGDYTGILGGVFNVAGAPRSAIVAAATTRLGTRRRAASRAPPREARRRWAATITSQRARSRPCSAGARTSRGRRSR